MNKAQSIAMIEDFMCNALRALVEEFGYTEVIMCFPALWSEAEYTPGSIAFFFETVNTVEILVPNYGIKIVRKVIV